ncbi:transposase [Rhizobium leguminosarum bv. viciae]|nr:transposase [Rhizobium leguminosarum bv. viciae]
MTKHPIEVITSVERRRRWSQEDKERLVAACLEPGAVLSEIARISTVSTSSSSTNSAICHLPRQAVSS